MIIRVFRARPRAGHAVDEFARFAEEVTIPFVESQPGLVARYTGRGIGDTGEELTMITVWEDLEAVKSMAGDEWERPVMPDRRAEGLIAEVVMHHYEVIG
jgi:heme-degrading monooxygenase HmoA